MIFSSFTELFIRELWCKYKSIQIMEILCLNSWQLLMNYMVKKHFNVSKNLIKLLSLPLYLEHCEIYTKVEQL